MPLKVMTILGTRPELIKLSRIIAELDQHMSHIFVHTGQNYDYELNEIFFNDLEIRKPDYFLSAATSNLAETIANVIKLADEVMEKEKPDAILYYGDTNSCLSVIAAKRRKIPVFHMEAGNRCFDQRVPEELNRKVIDHLSDINMVHSEHARRYLLNEGINPETIIKTGSPMREIFTYYKNKIDGSDVLKDLNLSARDYFVVSAHREENVDSEKNFSDLLNTLNSLAQKHNKRIIVSTHPRTRKKLEELAYSGQSSLVEFMKPLGFLDYVKLQQNSCCVISDSGTITEESSLLNFPAIMVRQAHERPEGMDVGAVVMSGLEAERVLESVELVMAQFEKCEKPSNDIVDYSADKVSFQVVKIIQSYVDYVNRTVWKKNL